MRAFSILLASLAVTAPAQNVSFTTAGMRVGPALEAMGKAAGVRLEAAPNIAGEPIVLRLKDVPLNLALEKIATAMGARWTKDGTAYRLGRPQEVALEQARNDREAFGRLLAELIEERLKALEDQPELTEAAAREMGQKAANSAMILVGGPITWTPPVRMLAEAIRNIEPRALGELAENPRVVFSTAANRMQRPLPGNTLATLRRQMKLLSAYAAGIRGAGDENAFVAEAYRGDYNLGLSKVMVVFTMSGGGLMASMTAVDPNGGGLAQASLALGAIQPMRSGTASSNDTPLRLTAEQKEYLTLFSVRRDSVGFAMATAGPGGSISTITVRNAPTGAPLTPELRDKIRKPDVYDPLSLGVGAAILDMAEQGNQQLVAQIHDRAAAAVTALLAQNTGAGALWSALNGDPTLTVKAEDGWIEVAPRYPSLARKTLCDRVGLAKLIQGMVAEGTLRLDPMATYAARADRELQGNDIDAIHIANADPNFGPGDLDRFSNQSWHAARLWGLLDGTQRLNLANGRPLAFGILTPSQLKPIQQILLGQQGGMFIILSTPSRGVLAQEPTERFPNGLPSNGAVTLRIRTEAAAIARDPGSGSGMAGTMATFGVQQSLITSLPPGAGVAAPRYTEYRPADARIYAFRFEVPNDPGSGATLLDIAARPNTRFGTLDALPAEHREAYRSAPKISIGSSSGAPPPP